MMSFKTSNIRLKFFISVYSVSPWHPVLFVNNAGHLKK